MSKKIAFNTANLVGRVTDYRFKLSDWMKQHELTAKKTDEREWSAICKQIADAGYTAVEVWLAHVDPSTTDEKKARLFGRIMADHGLAPIGLAGTLNDATARICQWLNIPAANGGFWGTDLPTVKRLVASTGIRFNYENHPEKEIDELKAKIEGGLPGIGLAVDTGWLVTQGMATGHTIRNLGNLVQHVHIKDVRPGTHETVPLGTGGANIPGVVRALREKGYTGWYSWEDEPEDRNPFDIAAEMRVMLEELLDAPLE